MRALRASTSLVSSQSHGDHAATSYDVLQLSRRFSCKKRRPCLSCGHSMAGYTYRHTDWGILTLVSRKPGRARAAQIGFGCLEGDGGAPCGLLRARVTMVHGTNDGSWTRAASWIWFQCHGRPSTDGVCLPLHPPTKSVSEFATSHRLVSDAHLPGMRLLDNMAGRTACCTKAIIAQGGAHDHETGVHSSYVCSDRFQSLKAHAIMS